MANHSLKAAVKRQHCSLLRLTICAVRKEREREAKKQAKHAQQVPKKPQRTLDAFCVAAPPRADVASSGSNLPQPSQSSQPPVATQSQPQSDSNRKGKERAPSSQPKPRMWHWGIVRNMCVLKGR